MGAFLDSAKNIRQIKKNSPWQAYKIKKKLAKNKEQGIEMANEQLDLRVIKIFAQGHSFIVRSTQYIATDKRQVVLITADDTYYQKNRMAVPVSLPSPARQEVEKLFPPTSYELRYQNFGVHQNK